MGRLYADIVLYIIRHVSMYSLYRTTTAIRLRGSCRSDVTSSDDQGQTLLSAQKSCSMYI